MKSPLLKCLPLALLPLAAAAGEVTLHRIDLESTEVTKVAAWQQPHAPVSIIERSSRPYFIDACGNLGGMAEDRYGEMSYAGVKYSDPALPGITWLKGSEVGIRESDGTLFRLHTSGFEPDTRFELQKFQDQPVAEMQLLVAPDKGQAPLFIDDQGRLVLMRAMFPSISEMRRVSGVENLQNVVAGVHTLVVDAGAGNPGSLFVNKDGSAQLLDIREEGWGDQLRVEATAKKFAGSYPDTIALFPPSYGGDPYVYRLDASGGLHRIQVRRFKQSAMPLPAPVHGRAIHFGHNEAHYISTNGSFSGCPVAAAPVAAPEPAKKDDKGVFQFIEKMEAAYDRNLPYFKKMEAAWDGMNTLQNDQLVDYFTPYAEAIRDFRQSEEGKVVALLDALEKDFGGKYELARFLSEVTDGKVRGFSSKVDELINQYAKYRDRVIPGIAQGLSSRAEIALQIAEFKGADKTDEKMALYENALKAASWAHFFDPQMPGPDELKAQMGAARAAAEAAEKDALEKNNWPGRYARYTGGNADGVEAAALKYMQTKYPGEILKVAIAGDWYVYKEDIYGHPTSYCVPLHVGMKNMKDPTRGYINTGSICTQGNQPEPPFNHYAWLSESDIVKIERLK